MKEKGFVRITIMILALVIIIILGISYCKAHKSPDGISNVPTTWLMYTNTKYGFSFSYPSYLADTAAGPLEEYPNGSECTASQTSEGTPINYVLVAVISNDMNIEVACEKLTPTYINQFNDSDQGDGPNQFSTTTIAGHEAYQNYSTDGTYYQWDTDVAIDDSHYLEFNYSGGGGLEHPVSQQDWNTILASVRFLNINR
jgi:hypothetical protein